MEEGLLGWEDGLEAAATPAQIKGLLGSLEAALHEDWLSAHYQRTPKLVALAWPACGEINKMLQRATAVAAQGSINASARGPFTLRAACNSCG